MDTGRAIAIDTSLIECVVVVVPDTESLVGIAEALAALVADGSIRVLDLVVVVRDRGSGDIRVLGPESVHPGSFGELVDERVAELLSERDINSAAASLLPGAAAVLVLIEDRWATVLSSAAVHAGGRIVGGTRVARARIEAALQASPAVRTSDRLHVEGTDNAPTGTQSPQ